MRQAAKGEMQKLREAVSLAGFVEQTLEIRVRRGAQVHVFGVREKISSQAGAHVPFEEIPLSFRKETILFFLSLILVEYHRCSKNRSLSRDASASIAATFVRNRYEIPQIKRLTQLLTNRKILRLAFLQNLSQLNLDSINWIP